MNGIKSKVFAVAVLLHGFSRVTAQSAAAMDDAVVKKVMALPEVQKGDAYIDSFSKHQHGISILIQRRPGNGVDYYWLQAGYNGDLRYEPYFNFYVYPPKLTIKFYDTVTDSVYSLEEWRRRLRLYR
jgi:hypothetical protein